MCNLCTHNSHASKFIYPSDLIVIYVPRTIKWNFFSSDCKKWQNFKNQAFIDKFKYTHISKTSTHKVEAHNSYLYN